MTLEFFPCAMLAGHVLANFFVQRAIWRRDESIAWKLFWSVFTALFFVFGPLFYGIAAPPRRQEPDMRIKGTAAITERW